MILIFNIFTIIIKIMNLRTSSTHPRLALIASAIVALSGFGNPAFSQGLLGIGTSGSEITQSSPLKISVGVDAGYDSNSTTSAKDENSSAYVGAGVGLFYTFANELTRLDLGGNLGAQYYDDAGSMNDNVFYNTRFTANVSHEISDRFRITNNGLVSYETEPDYFIGASVALRDDQYLFFYDRISGFYEINKRWSSVTGYGIEGITYEDEILSEREDRLTHTISQQLRYSFTPKTTGRAEYRLKATDYDSIDYDSMSHFALAGVDHRFSETTVGTLVAGAEFRDYEDMGSDSTSPHAEAALTHRLSDRTSLRWLARAGLEDNEIFGFSERYSYRTGITMDHAFTDRLRATGGASYVFSDFEGDIYESMTEDTIALQAGLAYRVVQNVDLRLSYYFTQNDSDDENRDYDRHRVSLGATASF